MHQTTIRLLSIASGLILGFPVAESHSGGVGELNDNQLKSMASNSLRECLIQAPRDFNAGDSCGIAIEIINELRERKGYECYINRYCGRN